MNKKLIIAAVSAAVMAPVAAHAESSFYGRIVNSYQIDSYGKKGEDTKTDIATTGSRFGFRANTDVGNGLSVHGQLEFDITTDKEGSGLNDTRVGSVGFSGPFGRVDAGNLWSAYFNTFGTNVSPTYWLGGFIYSSVGGGPFRASNTVKYSNTFGPVSLQLDARFNESNEDGDEGGDAEKLAGDGIGLGVSFKITDSLTIGLATDTEEGADTAAKAAVDPVVATADIDGVLGTAAVEAEKGVDTKRNGISAKIGIPGGLSLGLGAQTVEIEDAKGTKDGVEIESQFLYLSGSFTDNTTWLLGAAQSETDYNLAGEKNDEADQTVWGVYHAVGGGFTLFYEGINKSLEKKSTAAADDKDGSVHVLGMRINF